MNQLFGLPALTHKFRATHAVENSQGQCLLNLDFTTAAKRRLGPISNMIFLDGGGAGIADIGITVPGALYLPWVTAVANPTVYMTPLPGADFETILHHRVTGRGTNMWPGIWVSSNLAFGAGNQSAIYASRSSAAANLAGIRTGTGWNNILNETVTLRWHYPESWIRVKRIGAIWSAAWSPDGLVWTTAITWAPGGTPAYIGFGTGQGVIAGLHNMAVYSFRIFTALPTDTVGRSSRVLQRT